jgi:sodium-dependent dicarboxylate transporter 2/3/5
MTARRSRGRRVWRLGVLFASILAAPLPLGHVRRGRDHGGPGVWMVAWWVTQAVPIAVTSLLPLLVLPLTV